IRRCNDLIMKLDSDLIKKSFQESIISDASCLTLKAEHDPKPTIITQKKNKVNITCEASSSSKEEVENDVDEEDDDDDELKPTFNQFEEDDEDENDSEDEHTSIMCAIGSTHTHRLSRAAHTSTQDAAVARFLQFRQ